jgi:hypothetical protein
MLYGRWMQLVFTQKSTKKVTPLLKGVRLETAYMVFRGVLEFRPPRDYGLEVGFFERRILIFKGLYALSLHRLASHHEICKMDIDNQWVARIRTPLRAIE